MELIYFQTVQPHPMCWYTYRYVYILVRMSSFTLSIGAVSWGYLSQKFSSALHEN